MILVLDPGHNKNTAGKRSPDGSLREFEFNQTVANMAEEILYKYVDIKVILTKQMNDVDVLLAYRTQIANEANADLFLSIHANVHGDGSTWTTANGFEIYHYPGSLVGRRLAEIGNKHAAAKTNLRDRGIKTSNFHVLRETKMPAAVFEFGFMTNRTECELLKTPAFRRACAEAVALTALEWFKIPLIDDSLNDEEMKTSRYYRVFVNDKQIAAFNIRENAYNLAQKQRETYDNVYIIEPDGTKVIIKDEQVYKEQPTIIDKGEPIFGQSKLSAHHLDYFVRSVNPDAPYVAQYYIELGSKMGIRGDIVFCQAVYETGWFRFGGEVSADQNNYWGCGAVGIGIKGHTFDSPRQGVLAHLQHLWAYASTEALPPGEKLIDPRFDLVTRGSAKIWEALAGKWSVPGYDKSKYSSFEAAFKAEETYGQRILNIYRQAQNFVPPAEEVNPEDSSDNAEIKKFTKTCKVFFTCTNIEGKPSPHPSVIIDGKGYVGVSDIAPLFGYRALYDKLLKEILLVKGV